MEQRTSTGENRSQLPASSLSAAGDAGDCPELRPGAVSQKRHSR